MGKGRSGTAAQRQFALGVGGSAALLAALSLALVACSPASPPVSEAALARSASPDNAYIGKNGEVHLIHRPTAPVARPRSSRPAAKPASAAVPRAATIRPRTQQVTTVSAPVEVAAVAPAAPPPQAATIVPASTIPPVSLPTPVALPEPVVLPPVTLPTVTLPTETLPEVVTPAAQPTVVEMGNCDPGYRYDGISCVQAVCADANEVWVGDGCRPLSDLISDVRAEPVDPCRPPATVIDGRCVGGRTLLPLNWRLGGQ